MEYTKKSVNGDAGEHLLAYRVTRVFGWPCRLLDVDIGVDAEMEILDEAGHSTGDFIKIQIKSFDKLSSDEAKRVYVTGKHLEYWKRCSVPVIMCCVDLNQEAVYWKPIATTDSYSSSGQANVVHFDLAKDQLCGGTAAALRALVTPEASKQIEPLFQQLRKLHKEARSMPTTCVDGEQLGDIERHCDAARSIVRQIRELHQHFPWRASALALRELAIMERDIQITENDASHSYAVGVNGM